MLKKIIGFTLAEVLITLGIIGVVAALTIPTLIKKYQQVQFKSQFKKEFSTLVNATNEMKSTYDAGDLRDMLSSLPTAPTSNSGYKSVVSNELAYEYSKHIKTSVVCYYMNWMTPDTCWPIAKNPHYYSNNQAVVGGYSSVITGSTNGAGFITVSGAEVWFNVTTDPTCATNQGGSCPGICTFGGIDVNGDKGPDRLGYDIFNFILTKDSVEPAGYGQCGIGWDSSPQADDCKIPGVGKYCAVKVLSNQSY